MYVIGSIVSRQIVGKKKGSPFNDDETTIRNFHLQRRSSFGRALPLEEPKLVGNGLDCEPKEKEKLCATSASPDGFSLDVVNEFAGDDRVDGDGASTIRNGS